MTMPWSIYSARAMSRSAARVSSSRIQTVAGSQIWHPAAGRSLGPTVCGKRPFEPKWLGSRIDSSNRLALAQERFCPFGQPAHCTVTGNAQIDHHRRHQVCRSRTGQSSCRISQAIQQLDCDISKRNNRILLEQISSGGRRQTIFQAPCTERRSWHWPNRMEDLMIEFKAGDIVTVSRLNCYDEPITQTVQLIERQKDGNVPGWSGRVQAPRKQKGRLTWIADGEMPDLPGQRSIPKYTSLILPRLEEARYVRVRPDREGHGAIRPDVVRTRPEQGTANGRLSGRPKLLKKGETK